LTSNASTFVLLNPKSRSGATGRRIGELEALLGRYVGAYELACTERAGDGERLARLAAERGATRIVIAGGDGTASEAVDGLLQMGRGDIEIALLPLGTGRDFARGLGLGTDLEACVARIASGHKRKVDAGRVHFRAPGGGDASRCFLNMATLGIPAESARWLAERDRAGKRGPLSYVISGVVGMLRAPKAKVTLRVDDRVVHDGPLAFATASNGRYFAGGMRVAPGAEIDDGLFDVVVANGMSVPTALFRFPSIFFGRHIDEDRIRVIRGAVMHAESVDEVWTETDGEPVGTLPATFEILPGAVTLCGLA
jgi:YegS/Rv2252/BmrU family lipid kinase